MTPSIITIIPKKLVGKRLTMSLASNATQELWKSFMPFLNSIPNAVGTNKYSMQIYPDGYFNAFDPETQFEKWAAIEVSSFNNVPPGLDTIVLRGGLYAVFYYKGNPANGAKVFKNIFTVWLPQSGYVVDDRPHFEVLGDKYMQGSDDSEEEIWVPVRLPDL